MSILNSLFKNPGYTSFTDESTPVIRGDFDEFSALAEKIARRIKWGIVVEKLCHNTRLY